MLMSYFLSTIKIEHTVHKPDAFSFAMSAALIPQSCNFYISIKLELYSSYLTIPPFRSSALFYYSIWLIEQIMTLFVIKFPNLQQFNSMGNNFELDQFKQTAPVELGQANFNKDSMMLDMKINPGVDFSNWKWNLAPFESKNKHLFLPNRFIDPDLQPSYSKSSGCKQKTLFKQQIILAQYQPFIFTLQTEILTRKSRKLNFKQHELWKILKSVVLAFRDWFHAYPDLPIGPVTPSQILFNPEGHIRLMNRFSFIEQNPLKTSQYYPELRNFQTALSQSIYNLGIALIDTVTLEQSRYSNMSLQQKKLILSKFSIYPLQIKRTILAMIQPDPKIRIKLSEIISNIKYYKRISQQKQQSSKDTNTYCIG